MTKLWETFGFQYEEDFSLNADIVQHLDYSTQLERSSGADKQSSP